MLCVSNGRKLFFLYCLLLINDNCDVNADILLILLLLLLLLHYYLLTGFKIVAVEAELCVVPPDYNILLLIS